ncbi:MAG: hypothetical protein IJT03_08850 [Clostridia bacterium]|nr:hypothetical protein [Clostridia bacterium]
MDRFCIKCGKKLTHNEIGLHKKLVNRGSVEFLCMGCLCERFKITTGTAYAMIEKFKRNGCTLFSDE